MIVYVTNCLIPPTTLYIFYNFFNCLQSDEEDASEEESGNENEGRQSKRRRLNEEDILRRSERRKWVENRATILFNYLQYSYYGKSVCIIIYDFNNNNKKFYF